MTAIDWAAKRLTERLKDWGLLQCRKRRLDAELDLVHKEITRLHRQIEAANRAATTKEHS